MAEIINMPKLGLGMTYGTVTSVMVSEGDWVSEGDSLLEFETNKQSEELTAPIDGYVLKVCAKEGDEIPICKPLIVVGEKGEAFVLEDEEPEEAPVEVKPFAAKKTQGIQASPIAKKLAEELGVDIEKVAGSGPNGRIMREDIIAYTERKTTETTENTSDLSATRKIIAERMQQSKREIPHVYFKTVVDVTELMKRRVAFRESTGKRMTVNDVIVRAAALALRKTGKLNVSLREGKLHTFENINIGIAMNNHRGLMVPVIRNADKKTAAEIAEETRMLIEKCRADRLSREEMSGGTFSISNLGGYGVREFYAIINAPEAAILSVGEVFEIIEHKNGKIASAQKITLCLSVDHRIIDGIVAAEYLKALKEMIEVSFETVV